MKAQAVGLLTFVVKHFLVMGAVLCIVGCLAASLASTSYIRVHSPPQVVTTSRVSGRCQISLGWGESRCEIIAPVENH